MHEYACVCLTCLYMDSGNLIPSPLDDATSALPMSSLLALSDH